MAGTHKVVGMDALMKNLDLLERTMTRDELAKLTMVGAEELRDWVRDACERALHMWTWTLWKSIKASVDYTSASVASARVYSTLIYAGVHEFGMTIYPRVKKFLSWIDRSTGKRMFAKKVTIPARPYFRPGIDEGKPHAIRVMYDYLAARISGLAFKK